MDRCMKESGIFGVDKIPEHWSLYKNKYLFKKKKSIVGDKYESYDLLSLTTKGIKIKDINNNTGKLPQSFQTYQEVDVNDLVLCLFDLDVSAVFSGKSDFKGMISPSYTIYECNDLIKADFAKLWFDMIGFDRKYIFYAKSLRNTINTDTFKEIVTAVPPISEQEKIIAYLDSKTLEIDNVINKTIESIEEYKKYKNSLITEVVMRGFKLDIELKDSEVDYIGMVPKAWRVTKLKNVVKKLSRPIEPESEILICSNSGNVIFRGDKRIGLVSANEDGYQGVKEGDLLIHGMDTWHGAIAVSEHSGKCTPVVHVCDSDENKKFIAYYLRALAFKKVYKAITNGVRENTSDFRSWGKAGGIVLILPTKLEQDEIVQYLDKKCNEIDEIILKKQNLIKEMKDYKNALIYECVTGKKEI